LESLDLKNESWILWLQSVHFVLDTGPPEGQKACKRRGVKKHLVLLLIKRGTISNPKSFVAPGAFLGGKTIVGLACPPFRIIVDKS
jgi:hypothetical protein